MLRAIRRVLRPGGRMAFFTIHPAPGLDCDARRLVVDAGPQAVTMRSTYERLLASARFADVESQDVSEEYLATQRGWIDGYSRHESELRRLLGDAEYDERTQRRDRALAAIEAGVLRRSLFVARA